MATAQVYQVYGKAKGRIVVIGTDQQRRDQLKAAKAKDVEWGVPDDIDGIDLLDTYEVSDKDRSDEV